MDESSPRGRIAVVAVVLGAALLPLLGTGVPLDEVATPGAVGGQLALGTLFLIGARYGPRGGRRDPVLRLFGLLWLLGAVATLMPRPGPTVQPAELVAGLATYQARFPADLDGGLRELARLGVVILAVCAAARTPPRWVLAGFGAGSVVVGLRGLREYLLAYRGGEPAWRVFAGFNSPNQLASYLLVALPVVLLLAALAGDDSPPARWLAGQDVKRPGLKLRILLLGLAALLLLVLALTGSRGGLLGVGLALAAAMLGSARRGGRRAVLVAIAGLGLLVALGSLGPLRQRLLAGATQSHSARFRALTWSGTVDLARRHPALGVGLGGWLVVYPIYARASFTQHAHNGYLQMAAETGAAGLLLYLGIFGLWLARAWRASGSDEPRVRAYGVALLAATVGFGLHNALDYGWYVTAVAAGLAMLGAATWQRTAPADERPTTRVVAAAGVLLLLLLTAIGSAERARADGQKALSQGRLAVAQAKFEAATRAAPWSALAYEDLAGALAYREGRRADQVYRRAITLRPTSARLHYRYAAYLAERKELIRALEESAIGAALSPLHLQGYLQLGELLEQAGRPTDARRIYERMDAVARSPELTEARPIQGFLFEPTHAYGLLRLAELALRDGDAAVARDAFERALPDFEAYLETFRREEQVIADLPLEDQRELLAGRGLDPRERREVRRLVRRAKEAIGDLAADAAVREERR